MIYFIGAGAGDPDLITVKGAEILKNADVIIYAGSLVNFELVKKYARPDCKLFNSAKMALPEILDVFKKSHEQNLLIARLHSGDPSIFGAIREQINFLSENNIEFEIIPGVSSFSAAAASLKTAYTIPEISQKIVISRLAKNTPFDKNNQAEIYFLSSGDVEGMCENLIANGHNEHEKVALVYKASWPDEKIILADLKTLPDLARENNIENCALILIGKFLDDVNVNSKLYDPKFKTGFRGVH